jgi:hypothetical protein
VGCRDNRYPRKGGTVTYEDSYITRTSLWVCLDSDDDDDETISLNNRRITAFN